VKYTAKLPRENYNVTKASPLKDFFLLLGALLGIIVSVYAALGYAVDMIAPKIPPEIETRLGRAFSGIYRNEEATERARELQKILDGLVNVSLLDSFEYKTHLVADPVVNALALPGGHIVVFTGLVDEVESENELAFILAHELGHFAHKDHLKGLGRSLVFFALSATLLGSDSSVTQIFGESLQSVEMKFSQHQESMADLWAVELLNKRYGHTSGALDLFEKLAERERRGRLSFYFATHPHPSDRVRHLTEYIDEKGYPKETRTTLHDSFK
jgi:Zn-dependent protease with chaperone function